MSEVPSQVTLLLGQWNGGDKEALRRLLPLIYNELHRLAHQQLRKERPNHRLQTTALVNKAYSQRAQRGPGKRFHNRAHICAVSAHLTRQILIQYARRGRAIKRDGGYKITLDDATGLAKSRAVDLLELEDALNALAKLDPQQSAS